MRLFIALPLPPDVRRALAQIQLRLKQLAPHGRFVAMENFHITLHFIGESRALLEAARACDEAARGIRPFVLRLNHYKSFKRGDTHTGYVALRGDLKELHTLYETLTAALKSQGFACGEKRIVPHITLARALICEGDISVAMQEAFLTLGGGGAFSANQLVLYDSRHERGKLVYAPLHRSKFL
ncbi:MAG: RNA 2',3'-cyclic phosphodiesterase [Clostridiales bacterium]|jgi:2'-5' RNA ligase|nr:RNA 2',3'-cyclic phosphodiesterase [Clostridiales bacterium]